MQNTSDPSQYQMGVMEHLRELRKRLFYSIVAVLLGAIASYYFSSDVFNVLCEPYFRAFSNSPLIGTSPAEAWLLKVKVALFCGALVTSPFTFYQLWLFVAPGLYQNERKLVIPFVLLSSLLFIGGTVFCYFAVLPFTLSFFYGEFLSINVTPTIKIGDHLAMTITTLLGFGVVFELPLLSFFLTRAGVIDHSFLIQWYRHAIVLIFIVAAVLTPPDALTQLLMAGPLLLLYALSILVAYLTARSSNNRTEELSTPSPPAIRA